MKDGPVTTRGNSLNLRWHSGETHRVASAQCRQNQPSSAMTVRLKPLVGKNPFGQKVLWIEATTRTRASLSRESMNQCVAPEFDDDDVRSKAKS